MQISELCITFEREIYENNLPLIISYQASAAKKLLLLKLLDDKNNWLEVLTHFIKPQCPNFRDNGTKVLDGWGMLCEEYRRQTNEILKLTQREHLIRLMQEILAT